MRRSDGRQRVASAAASPAAAQTGRGGQALRIDIITIFPEYFAPLRVSLIGKAVQRGDIVVAVHDLRAWADDPHRTVDDTPFGGGPGMVMKPEPWGRALDAIAGRATGAPGSAAHGSADAADPVASPAADASADAADPPAEEAGGPTAEEAGGPTAEEAGGPAAEEAGGPPGEGVGGRAAGGVGGRAEGGAGGPVAGPELLVPTPAGAMFTQAMAGRLARAGHLIFACGRYEGIDARFPDYARRIMPVHEISIGDYVLAGGEPAALVMVEAICRLLPGVLGNEDSALDDSFGPGPMHGLMEGPAFTRPRVWRGMAVPDVLLSGNHAEIARWRRDEALRRTARTRPDLAARLPGAGLDARDRQVLSDAGFAGSQEDVAH